MYRPMEGVINHYIHNTTEISRLREEKRRLQKETKELENVILNQFLMTMGIAGSIVWVIAISVLLGESLGRYLEKRRN